jgi:two-component system LytT family response regulator
MTLRVAIVDDEELARRGIHTRLQRFPDVEIVADCSNGRQAVDSIRRRTPDLVFLDVQMSGKTGFDVIE